MKIRVLPFQPHCFAFGGFEIQMLNAIEAARACGVDVQPMDVWNRDANFDVLHVWGLDMAHMPAIYWARRSAKRVVMTALLPDFTTGRRLRHWASSLVGTAKLRDKLLDLVNVLVVVNDAQAETACRMLGMPCERVFVIPNIVEAPYFDQTTRSAGGDIQYGYVLCAGNVCARKNQVGLAKACLTAGYRLVIIGNVLTGEEAYGNALARIIEGQESVRWVPETQPCSADLVRAYRECGIFALPSHDETQPISLLEAAAARKPLLTSNRAYARQKYYRNAYLVDPASETSMVRGLRAVYAEPDRYVPTLEYLDECRRERVGAAYKRAYENAQSITD